MVAVPASEPVTPTSSIDIADIPVINERPKDVGILAMEMYFPARVRPLSNYHSIQLTARPVHL